MEISATNLPPKSLILGKEKKKLPNIKEIIKLIEKAYSEADQSSLILPKY